MTECKNIYAALAKAQSDIGAVSKDKTAKVKTKNGHDFSYTYASLDNVLESLREPMKTNGLAIAQSFISKDGRDYLKTMLLHESGEMIDFGCYPLGNPSSHQERGSAITYARRYSLCAVFAIAPEDDDDAQTGNDTLSKKRAPEPAFETPQLMNQWVNNATAALNQADSLDALKDVFAMYGDKLKTLANGSDVEQIAYQEVVRAKDNRKLELTGKNAQDIIDDSLSDVFPEPNVLAG